MCIFAMCVPALAQSVKGQWVGDSYLVFSESRGDSYVFIDENDNIQLTIPSVKNAVDFPVPYEFCRESSWWSSCWRNDALYTLAYGAKENNEDGSRFTRWTFAKWQNNEWRLIGEYKAPAPGLLSAIPCDRDRFIAISSAKDLSNDGRIDRTPFHLMSVIEDRKEINLDSPIDHGQDELRKYMSNPECFELAWSGKVVMTDSHAVLVSKNTGLYWIFSLEKASLTKAGNIFKSATPEWIAKGGFAGAVICVNPEKNGTVLISALEESLFMKERADANKIAQDYEEKYPYLEFESILSIMEFYQKEIDDRNPFIVWYRIHPESGKAEKLDAPPEGGTYLRSGWKKNIWRPMPDGSIKMGWNERNITEKAEIKPGPTNDAGGDKKIEPESEIASVGDDYD
jgi:hypothetical protein